MSDMRGAAVSVAAIAAAVLLLTVASAALGRPELLPSPMTVAQTLASMAESGELGRAILTSLSRVLTGYIVGALLGILTGLLLGRIRLLDDSLGILFDFAKGIPPIALVPIVVIWFGIGEISKWIIVAYIVWIVVTISTTVGAREVPLLRLRTAAFMGLGPIATFWRVILPSVMPFVSAGLRNAIGFAFVALVSAELVGANSGVGQIIMDARFALQTDRMLAGLLTLGILGALCQVLFDLIGAHNHFR